MKDSLKLVICGKEVVSQSLDVGVDGVGGEASVKNHVAKREMRAPKTRDHHRIPVIKNQSCGTQSR